MRFVVLMRQRNSDKNLNFARSGIMAWCYTDNWFAHLAIEVPTDGASNEWLEEVSDELYKK